MHFIGHLYCMVFVEVSAYSPGGMVSSTTITYAIIFLSSVQTCIVAETLGVNDTDVPTGCKVTSRKDGKVLYCQRALLMKVLPVITELGPSVVSVIIQDCQPAAGVNINGSYFENSTTLKQLEIISCGIAGIAPNTFHKLGNLTELNLDRNHINVIVNGTFEGLENLLLLSLSRNEIYSVEDGALGHLNSLETLRFDRNLGFGPSPLFLAGMKHLKVLVLFNVYIGDGGLYPNADYADFFKDQEDSLIALTLEQTYLSNKVLPMVKNLKKLQVLDVMNNRLGYISKGSLPKLAMGGTLKLAYNRIMYFEEEVLSVYTRDDNLTLWLDDNPFYCDCNLLGFSRWLRANNETESVHVPQMDMLECGGPVSKYQTKVMDYDAHWWQCSQYVPLIALVAIVGLALIIAVITCLVCCNRVNFKHWQLERKVALHSKSGERSHLVKGKTGAYIIYNYREVPVLQWVNKYLQRKLFDHPMHISLQFAAGPEAIPLWQQVKEHGFDVNHFLVIVTDDILQNHWPEMSEKSGFENLAKFVLVLMGKKKGDLPRDLIRLNCPCLEWPETVTYFTSLQREREQFWKRLRLALKEI